LIGGGIGGGIGDGGGFGTTTRIPNETAKTTSTVMKNPAPSLNPAIPALVETSAAVPKDIPNIDRCHFVRGVIGIHHDLLPLES
jgi:hypothetical protein